MQVSKFKGHDLKSFPGNPFRPLCCLPALLLGDLVAYFAPGPPKPLGGAMLVTSFKSFVLWRMCT